MTTNAPRRFRIVVALDRSEYADIVLQHAIDQAARHDRPDLHFLTVVDQAAREADVRASVARLVLQGLETLGQRRKDVRSWLHVLVGDPADEIGAFAADTRADLVVIGRFGVHQRRGSTADGVLAIVPCPTLVVVLKDDTVATQAQCPACEAVREATDAERLFCDKHVGDRMRLSGIVGSSISIRGGSVW